MSARLSRLLWLAGVVAAPALAGSSGGVGYAQASGYFKKDTRPTLYQPLNLLDARDNTAWCSPTADPLNELITFGFNGRVKLEELKFSTGNNFDANTFATFGRARKLALKSGKQVQTFTVEDVRGLQTVTLDPPMVGARFSLEVLDQYPAEDPDVPVCISDIVFVAEGRQLNGQWLTTKLKYDRAAAGVLGTWYAGFESTPDRFLAFNFDGTFRYSFEPYDTTRAKEKVIEGSYDVGATRLVLEVAGKKYGVKYAKEPAKKGFTLSFDGNLPEELKQAFRSVP